MAKPKVRILYHDIDKVDSQVSSKSDLNHMALHIERARRMSPLKFSLDRPDCILKLVKNEPLTKSGCKDEEVHHFEFEFVSSPIPYEVGDVLEVLPSQNPAAVDAFILRCNLDPESFITVHPSEMENQLSDTCIPIKLKTFVELTMDIASASPRLYFFEGRI